MRAGHAILVAGLLCGLTGSALAHDPPRARGHDPGWHKPWPGQVQQWHRPADPWPGSAAGPRGRWEGSRQDIWGGSAWRIEPQHPAERYTAPPYRPPVIVLPQPAWYCPDPPGYYPYVPRCRIFWQQVPATRHPPW